MNKKEVLELKRRFKKDEATFTRLVGCYVDGNHNKICRFGGKFLNLEEEEYYKYLEIANKALSGTFGNIVAILLYTALSISPVLYMAYRKRKGRLIREDFFLPFISQVAVDVNESFSALFSFRVANEY